jgi:CspA family cold shock protein
MENGTQRGTVKVFMIDRGYGFIQPDDGGEDIFVHLTGCVEAIGQGDKVTFELRDDGRGRGPKAVNVRLD